LIFIILQLPLDKATNHRIFIFLRSLNHAFIMIRLERIKAKRN